ncbi:MAG: transglycosylase SLT domain-containing protein [Acidobacteria bacterium]|nr:transglycosylase SLT domain-containing protein [Acidobacteriota bacterium]
MKKIIRSFAILLFFSFHIFAQTHNDAVLARVTLQDKTSRDASGKLNTLSAAEHLFRADVYSANRQFPQAREHWQKILDNYSTEAAAMPKVLFGIARSYMWEREYQKAVFWFDKLTKDYLGTKEGREGLAYKGASYVRMNKNAEAAITYEQYTIMFPNGEKIESAYLNLIDSLREAKKYDEANAWVDKTRLKFSGLPTEMNALQARLRMEIYRGNWDKAISAAEMMLNLRDFGGSMTSADEVKYLKAFATEKGGRKSEAIAVYSSIADTPTSYYGGLATEKLKQLGLTTLANNRASSIPSSYASSYPIIYRAEILRYAKPRKIDPRFILAIMKQESSFRARAKSPSAARGLLQLVYDTAVKYNANAGFPNIEADDLYIPATNIAIGSAYIADLKNQFNDLYEAIAASYNGGEDNAARWLERSKPKEAGIFASEVGFAETKNYVFKVMNNFRVYRQLYTEELVKK